MEATTKELSSCVEGVYDAIAPEGPTVAVIGCGPGGMSFLHCNSSRRRKYIEQGDVDGLKGLPSKITVYEASSSVGGVWKAERAFIDSDEETTHASGNATGNMYEALWCNGIVQRIEFGDYTFQDHFQQDVPAYLPRAPLLEYLTERCTRNDPSIFEDHVKFNTTVTKVTYDEDAAKFSVTSRCRYTNRVTTEIFDKCIWAAGENGKASLPRAITNALEGFKGTVLHSSQVGTIDFGAEVEGKNIVLVGDSYSAEDLALVACQAGAAKIYVLSRGGDGIVCEVKSWPRNCVKVIDGMMIQGIIDEGNSLRLSQVEMDWDLKDYVVTKANKRRLKDISMVICCTGYSMNLSMLEHSLRAPISDENWWSGMPKDWKMKDNAYSEICGDVPVPDEIDITQCGFYTGIYHGMSIRNPNMMFILNVTSAPLFEIDIEAWLLHSYLTGVTPVPSVEEMNEQNNNFFIGAMDTVEFRWTCDWNYYQKFKEVEEELEEENEDHWFLNLDDPRHLQASYQELDLHLRYLAWLMTSGKYIVDFGTLKQLNDKAQALCKMLVATDHSSRLKVSQKDKAWSTFRDNDPSQVYSIHTGAHAVPLRKRWMELRPEDYADFENGFQKQRKFARTSE